MDLEKDKRKGEKKLEARQLLVPYSGGLTTLRPVEPVLRVLGAAFPTTPGYLPGKSRSLVEAVFLQQRASLRFVWEDKIGMESLRIHFITGQAMTTHLYTLQESQDPFSFFENFCLLLLKPQRQILRGPSAPILDTR